MSEFHIEAHVVLLAAETKQADLLKSDSVYLESFYHLLKYFCWLSRSRAIHIEWSSANFHCLILLLLSTKRAINIFIERGLRKSLSIGLKELLGILTALDLLRRLLCVTYISNLM